jgi:triphosphoribosyl-dephospho-CoA synthase
MGFYDFLTSSLALSDAIYQCALSGIFHLGPLVALLPKLRKVGRYGENQMFSATGGVNTHKGLLFSLGILAAAAGTVYTSGDQHTAIVVTNRAAQIVEGIVQRELASACGSEATYGERIYHQYGIAGIRGEAASGFRTVLSVGLPGLRSLNPARATPAWDDALVQVLLQLMTVTDDTNVLGRHDVATLRYVQQRAHQALALGGMFTSIGRTEVLAMDADFQQRFISPGGSADLLAVTLFLYWLEQPPIGRP